MCIKCFLVQCWQLGGNWMLVSNNVVFALFPSCVMQLLYKWCIPKNWVRKLIWGRQNMYLPFTMINILTVDICVAYKPVKWQLYFIICIRLLTRWPPHRWLVVVDGGWIASWSIGVVSKINIATFWHTSPFVIHFMWKRILSLVIGATVR